CLQGDPLPPSLVDLVRNSPISSVEDLKLLLQQETDSTEEEEDEHDILTNHTHGRYTRSLVEAQPAQQAVCKVRTEVTEVTRAMLDRRNANFLLWPPCVEVQRCSGCCNTRLLQCVPTVTATRYLQVIKIQYINKNAHYDKAIISVEDHVSCRCQAPTPQQPPPSPHLPLALPRAVHPAPPKSHASKADLHRHDDLKHNQQRYHPEEREPVARQWQQGRYTQLAHWTPPRAHQAAAAAAHPAVGGGGAVGGWPSEARAEQGAQPLPREGGHGSGFEGGREESGVRASHGAGELHHPDHAQRQQQLLQYQQQQQYQQQYQYHQQHQRYPQQPYQQYNHGPSAEDQELRTQYRLNAAQSDSASPPGNPTQSPNQKSEQNTSPPVPADHRDSAVELTSDNRQKDTEGTNHKQTEAETANRKEGNEREETGSANSGDAAGAELANREKDKDSKLTNGERPFTEEERRLKLLDIVQKEPDEQTHHQHHPHPADHHHPQHRPKPTALKTAVPTLAPSSPSARRAPFRPASPRRRRKHRSRISKAAIRAMIM
ncbi:platelet-derived growth factor beta polypeptide a, partial [Centroberyx affinis]|uniref:platelet-derived growth factor beta polypeptide a n=1 Tax=Centroberyx affinis TaxID=166261 RepID=UPI003A5C2989